MFPSKLFHNKIQKGQVHNSVWTCWLYTAQQVEAIAFSLIAVPAKSYRKLVGVFPLIFHRCLRLAVRQAFVSQMAAAAAVLSARGSARHWAAGRGGGWQTSHLCNPADKHSSISLVRHDNAAVFSRCYITLHFIYKRWRLLPPLKTVQ